MKKVQEDHQVEVTVRYAKYKRKDRNMSEFSNGVLEL